MPLPILCRHGASLRRAIASLSPVSRTSRNLATESLSFLHGNQLLSHEFSSSSLVLPKFLSSPLKWIAAAAYKQTPFTLKEETARPKPNRKINPFNPWKEGKVRQGNVAMVPAKKRSSNSKDPVLLTKSSQGFNALNRSRIYPNLSSYDLSRTLHSAIGDDEDDESDGFDDFSFKPEASNKKVRSSTSTTAKKVKPRAAASKSVESDDEVPIITTTKRRASAIDACEDSEEEDSTWSVKKKRPFASGASLSFDGSEESEEDTGGSARKKRRPAIKVKPRKSDDSRSLPENRAASMKKRPVALEGLFESKSEKKVENFANSTQDDVVTEENVKDQESEPSDADTKSSEEDTDSGPSHLTKTRFDKFPISPLSIKALHTVLKYERMTEVQESTFPVILKGQDVLAKARTGTGKTIAFLLPAIETILKARKGTSQNPIYVVIVCPTRELAQQAAAEAQVLLQFHRGLGAQVVYGGNSIRGEQMNLSRKPCQILVGTPGRLVDHIQRTPGIKTQLSSVKMFVLDEADHMLDMGFRESLHKIMQALPSQRQTLLFSATIPKEVHNMAKIALRNDHTFIDAVGKDSQDTHAQVKQQYIMVPLEKQIRVLYAALQQHMEADPNYKVLVFCTTARVTGFMCKLFSNLGFNAREIHSRKDQNYRTRVSDEFRHSKGGIILFTSDVSARGVDYPNVTLVVQVGAPSEFEQYIHRLGRTGRAGKKGEGLLILAPWEDYFLQKLANLPITQLPAPKLTSQAKAKILSTACGVDTSLREMAYQAWIGYYRSLKGITLEKVMLVEYANQFSASMGFEEPPALSRMLASKMALAGVPGVRISR